MMAVQLPRRALGEPLIRWEGIDDLSDQHRSPSGVPTLADPIHPLQYLTLQHPHSTHRAPDHQLRRRHKHHGLQPQYSGQLPKARRSIGNIPGMGPDQGSAVRTVKEQANAHKQVPRSSHRVHTHQQHRDHTSNRSPIPQHMARPAPPVTCPHQADPQKDDYTKPNTCSPGQFSLGVPDASVPHSLHTGHTQHPHIQGLKLSHIYRPQ